MTGRGTVHEEHRGGSERDMNARGECDLFVNEQSSFPMSVLVIWGRPRRDGRLYGLQFEGQT